MAQSPQRLVPEQLRQLVWLQREQMPLPLKKVEPETHSTQVLGREQTWQLLF